MVKAAIGAEEEYKDTLYAHARTHASMRTHIADYSLYGHASSKPVLDGHLPVHHLVLREFGQGRVILPLVVGHSSQARLPNVPATLRASTLMRMTNSRLVRDASADRCVISTAPASPSSSRATGPKCKRPHVRICAALPPSRNLMSSSERSPGERDCRVDTGRCWGALRPRAPSTQPSDRHYEQVTPGHHWYMSRRLGSETGLRLGILRWTPTLRAQMRQRHTARTRRPDGRDTEDTHAHGTRTRTEPRTRSLIDPVTGGHPSRSTRRPAAC